MVNSGKIDILKDPRLMLVRQAHRSATHAHFCVDTTDYDTNFIVYVYHQNKWWRWRAGQFDLFFTRMVEVIPGNPNTILTKVNYKGVEYHLGYNSYSTYKQKK